MEISWLKAKKLRTSNIEKSIEFAFGFSTRENHFSSMNMRSKETKNVISELKVGE